MDKNKLILQVTMVLACVILAIINYYVQNVEESHQHHWYYKHKGKINLGTTASIVLLVGGFVFVTCNGTTDIQGGGKYDSGQQIEFGAIENTLHKSDSHNYESTEY